MDALKIAVLILSAFIFKPLAFSDGAKMEHKGNLLTKLLAKSIKKGPVEVDKKLTLRISLHNPNAKQLEQYFQAVNDPKNSLFHQYLTSAQFDAKFGGDPQVAAQVTAYFTSHGFSLIKKTQDNLHVVLNASVAVINKELGVVLSYYKNADGKTFISPSTEPLLDPSIHSLVQGVYIGSIPLKNKRPKQKKGGLVRKSALQARESVDASKVKNTAQTNAISEYCIASNWQVESGQIHTVAMVKTAYGIDQLPSSATGSGQSIAVVEFSDFDDTNIATYMSGCGYTNPSITRTCVSDYGGACSQVDKFEGETELDIELIGSVAPQANLLIFIIPTTATNVYYNDYFSMLEAVKDSNAAQVSSSLTIGTEVDLQGSNVLAALNSAYMAIAAIGKTMFVAAGDSPTCATFSEAASSSSCLAPSADTVTPSVVSVGGTLLTLDSTTSAIASETAWIPDGQNLAPPPDGTAGGISYYTLMPSWQNLQGSQNSQISSTHRMFPDVSLVASPETGYLVYIHRLDDTTNAYVDSWWLDGGTSAAAPVWTAYIALINQQRALIGQPPVGFINPALYAIGQGSLYSQVFNDITSGNSIDFNATSGYDMLTGWGSFKGLPFYKVFVPSTPSSFTFSVK
jgi:kumamolisin